MNVDCLLSVCHLIVFVSLVNTASVRLTSDCTLHPLEAGLSSEMTNKHSLHLYRVGCSGVRGQCLVLDSVVLRKIFSRLTLLLFSIIVINLIQALQRNFRLDQFSLFGIIFTWRESLIVFSTHTHTHTQTDTGSVLPNNLCGMSLGDFWEVECPSTHWEQNFLHVLKRQH